MKKIHSWRSFAVLLALASFVTCSGSSGNGNGNGNKPGGNAPAGNPPSLSGNCTVFPADNPWNRDVSQDNLHPNSSGFIDFILAHGGDFVHPDFGSNPGYGIPYAFVGSGQELVPMNFTAWPEESDPGPYPIPPNAPIEAGGDAHVLVVDTDACKLYEIGNAEYVGPGWKASGGAVFDLKSNALRPDSWTSADAAGLPIFPGLVRYDEAVEQKEIRHALRFTVDVTQAGYIHPATHKASSETNPNAPPMGLRLRLKADYNISGFTGTSRVVLEALKKYGMIVADNGGNWFLSGATDSRWNDEDLEQLKSVPGSAFEVVDTGPVLH